MKAGRLPICKSFMITEFGYNYRFTKVSVGESKNFYFMGDLGWMKNRNEKSAIGATAFFGIVHSGWRLGLKPRYRFWFGDSVSLDVSPGLFLWVHDDGFKSRFPPGFTGHVGLNLSNWFAFTSQLDVIPYHTVAAYDYQNLSGNTTEKGTDFVLYGGFRLGSTPGLVITATISALVLFLAASYSGAI